VCAANFVVCVCVSVSVCPCLCLSLEERKRGYAFSGTAHCCVSDGTYMGHVSQNVGLKGHIWDICPTHIFGPTSVRSLLLQRG
jgi:hypothetical protein